MAPALLVGVIHAGGLHNAVDTLQHIDPKLVSPHGASDILTPAFMTSFWVLVCFGVIGLPHTAVRCISYKDSKSVHRGIVIGTVVIALLMLGMHLAGALGRAVLPHLSVPDQVIPTLMVEVLPPSGGGSVPRCADGGDHVECECASAAGFRDDRERSVAQRAAD